MSGAKRLRLRTFRSGALGKPAVRSRMPAVCVGSRVSTKVSASHAGYRAFCALGPPQQALPPEHELVTVRARRVRVVGGIVCRDPSIPLVGLTWVSVCGLGTCLTPLLQDMVYNLTTFFTKADSVAERESSLSTAEFGVQ